MKSFDFDYSEFERFAQRFGEEIANKSADLFMEQSTRRLGQHVADEARKKTPIGKYGGAVSYTTRRGRSVAFNATPSRTGGLLERSWKATKLEKTSKGYQIDVINDAMVHPKPTHPLAIRREPFYYAPEVEYGHIATTLDRLPHVRDIRPVKETPVEGQYMLATTLEDLPRQFYPSLNKTYRDYLNRYMGGR